MGNYKSTEFVLTLVSAILIALGAVVDQNVFASYPEATGIATIAITILTSAYTLGRSFVKAKTTSPEVQTQVNVATSPEVG